MGLLFRIALTQFLEPWLVKKLESTLADKNPNYEIQISKIHISFISNEIELKEIILKSKSEYSNYLSINGKIEFVRLKGIGIFKAIFNKSIVIKRVAISGCSLNVTTPSIPKQKPSIIMPFNISIDSLLLDKTNLLVRNNLSSLSYSLNEGMIKLSRINIDKQDTLSIEKFRNLEFVADYGSYVSADSIYTYKLTDIAYSSVSYILSADTLSILPNFSDYDFASRFEFQKPRIESILSNICVHDFHTTDYLRSAKLSSSSIEIGNMEMKVFRDKRKEFRHVNKPEFQDMIYNYPGFLRLDTISILNGNITYKEYAEKANEPGYITFNELNASIYNITNDSVYMTKKAFLELRCSALLMGSGKVEVLLKSSLFDIQNKFSVNGTLSSMDISEMNPFLEKSASVYVTSGKLDRMDFSFTATSTESNGTMAILYNGLDLDIMNKNTGDTTAIRERLISFFANIKVIDSNPVPGEEARKGIIKYERDPEKFLFSYSARSILSGIKSSLLKN